jgi:predicted amidophosphoribosyltransferase
LEQIKIFNLKEIKKLLLDIFFPENCIICSRIGEIVCEECREEIKKDKANDENIKNINWIQANLSYKNEKLKKVLFSIKYHYLKSAGKYLAKIVYEDFYNFLKDKLSFYIGQELIIIPIPISKKRLIERSYNQTEILIKEIIREIKENKNLDLDLEKNIFIDLLIKNKHTIKFAETHSPTERENLIKDAFIVNEKYEKNFLENKIIILFDDITTTGSTFYEARNTLVEHGAKRENIFGYAVAH